MTKPPLKTPELFSYSAIADMKRIQTKYWPNDCPSCGQRMEFGFSPTVRRCGCGLVITEREANGK
jgi:hypothetical protein